MIPTLPRIGDRSRPETEVLVSRDDPSLSLSLPLSFPFCDPYLPRYRHWISVRHLWFRYVLRSSFSVKYQHEQGHRRTKADDRERGHRRYANAGKLVRTAVHGSYIRSPLLPPPPLLLLLLLLLSGDSPRPHRTVDTLIINTWRACCYS